MLCEPHDRRHPHEVRRVSAGPHGDVEAMAARVITRALQVPVTIQDDGSRDSMPDLLIEHPDGRAALGEVVLDADGPYVQTYAELVKRNGGSFPLELAAPGLARAWFVLVRVSRVGQLVDALPALLLDLETRGLVFEFAQRLDDGGDEPEAHELGELLGLGVVQLASRPLRVGETGGITVGQDGITGRADADEAVRWINERLTRDDLHDVARKLTGEGERHLVLGLTFSTSGDAFFGIAEEGAAMPSQAPALPVWATHLWLVPVRPIGRCVAWLPDQGWVDVTHGSPVSAPREQSLGKPSARNSRQATPEAP